MSHNFIQPKLNNLFPAPSDKIDNARILFDPKFSDNLTDILLSLLDSPIECDRLISHGY